MTPWQTFTALPGLTHMLSVSTEATIAAVSAGMVGAQARLGLRRLYVNGQRQPSLLERLRGAKADSHENANKIRALQVVNEWAYESPRLLRVAESPAWWGGLLIGGGLLATHLGALYPSPLAQALATNREITAAAPTDRPGLLKEQQEWVRMHLQKKTWSPIDQWVPTLSAGNMLRESTQAEGIVDFARMTIGIGLSMFFIGAIILGKSVLREGLGDRQKGRASWASRAEVIFSDRNYFKLPMRVSQRGKREWEDGYTAPWTVLAPSPASCASHGVIIGPTGSGKGAYSIGHIFATATVPILYQDSKSETPARHLRPDMLRFGISAKRPKGLPTMRFNPIAEIFKAGSESEKADRARDLANLLIPAPKDNKSDNSWIKETAQPLLAEGLLRGRWKHMGELADEVAGRKLPRILTDLGLPEGWMFGLEGKNAMEYAANEISNNTQPYLRGWARHAFSGSDFELEEVFSKGCYIMSATEDDQQKIPIRLFWNLVWARAQRSDKKMPCLVLVDEAIAAGRIPGIIEATVKLRDRGFSIWMAFQTYAGIETVYGRADAETLRRSLVNSIILTNGLDPKDAQEVTKELGSYTHTEKNKKAGTASRTAEPLMPQSDLNELAGQESEFWAIIRGRGMSKTGRPILAKLNAIEPGLWNCLATDDEWEQAERDFGHNDPIPSRFRYLIDPAFICLAQRALSDKARTELEQLAEMHGLDGLEERAAKLITPPADRPQAPQTESKREISVDF